MWEYSKKSMQQLLRNSDKRNSSGRSMRQMQEEYAKNVTTTISEEWIALQQKPEPKIICFACQTSSKILSFLMYTILHEVILYLSLRKFTVVR